MDFFKSLVLDAEEETPKKTPEDSESNDEEEGPVSEPEAEATTSWSFGGLIQTLTTRSESVLETYRRDLHEFGSGLKKETEIFREAANKAVKDLPTSIHLIDGVLKSTAEMIDEFGGSESKKSRDSVDSISLTRFEGRLKGVQSDLGTFRDEVEDLEEFGRWKVGFALIDRGEEIASLIGEGGVLEGVYKELVPREVDNETFWFRYFYRVHKLQQQESVRARLVRRAITIDEDDEELSWEVDDDEEDEDEEEEDGNVGGVVKEKGDGLVEKTNSSVQDSNVIEKEHESVGNVGEDKSNVESPSKKNDAGLVKVESEVKNEEKSVKLEDDSVVKNEEKLVKLEDDSVVKNEEKLVKLEDDSVVKNEEKSVKLEENSEVKKEDSEVKKDEKVEKSEEKGSVEEKGDEGGLVKEADVSGKSSQQSKVEEEDLEWDEIEDVDTNDEKKTASSVKKPDQADLLKRLSTADDDEDLSWDIEDDD